MSRSNPTDLQFDVRLIKRRGWITAEKLEKELSKLPDVSDKVTDPRDPSSEPAGDGSPESEPSAAATSAPEVSGADA